MFHEDAVLTVNNSGNITYAGTIVGSGKLTKGGSGSLTLSGANTYTGGTIINGGSLILGAAGVLSDVASVQLANTSGAILNLGNNDETIGALMGGGASGGNIVLGSGDLTVNSIYRKGEEGASQNTTYSGVISGSGSLIKTGYGILTLGRANTFTGGTTLSDGGLQLAVNNALKNTGTLTMSNAANFMINANISQTLGAFTGGSSNKVFVNVGAVLTINQSSDTTYAGTITGYGNARLIKTGSGTLTISGTNNITVE
jgi:autotransporter-associated beta strand protein